MYNEQEDFLHHQGEVNEALALLRDLGLALPAGATVLDVGGGLGMHAGFLQAGGNRVICSDVTDYSSSYAGELCKLLHEKHLRNGFALDLSRLALIQADAMNLLFRDGWFDACFSFNAFEHIPDPAKAFQEVARVLRPGGVAYITMDPIWTCDTGSHFFGYVPQPWQHLVASEESFRGAMKAAGASPGELAEYPSSMNRKRLKDYDDGVLQLVKRGTVKLVHSDRFGGLADPNHEQHPNFAAALARGYSAEELRLRRLRWVLKRV